ncbi:hypothetical protein HMN09_00969400 [Mycena chlorophos]|uniref:Roadblock/LAMTOR2 domain-containing protein n=1 Tax=Mycena chlorophos TaxID=658473 RepID=A0A8H6SIY7_MYCCL|nr:hypothetical protein HMN09_00969400 [Mycena chlorophos]
MSPVVARDWFPASSVREEETPEGIQQTVGPSHWRGRGRETRDIPLLIHDHLSTPTVDTLRASTSTLTNNTPPAASAAAAGVTPELEQTLSLLSSHRAVLGYILITRGSPVSIVRHAGVVFDGEQGKKYAAAIGKMVESVQTGLEEVHSGDGDSEDLRFLRIRTKRHEIMISPDDRYLLAVLYDPST